MSTTATVQKPFDVQAFISKVNPPSKPAQRPQSWFVDRAGQDTGRLKLGIINNAYDSEGNLVKSESARTDVFTTSDNPTLMTLGVEPHDILDAIKGFTPARRNEVLGITGNRPIQVTLDKLTSACEALRPEETAVVLQTLLRANKYRPSPEHWEAADPARRRIAGSNLTSYIEQNV